MGGKGHKGKGGGANAVPLGKSSKGSKAQYPGTYAIQPNAKGRNQLNSTGKKGGGEEPASIRWSNKEDDSDEEDENEGWGQGGRYR